MSIHRRTHPTFVPGCKPCEWASVAIAASATGNVRAQSANEMDKQWSRDMSAYKRLRADGLQPPRIDGCAQREATASTVKEVTR